jgi:glycosyltransferase involved in cell wall biosynthesis
MPDAAGATPLASIVLPVRNGVPVIGDCLRSILSMDAPRELYEVIVVDNGSTDETRDVVLAFGDEVVLLDEPRQGAGAARNRGIRAARGRFIALTDADCTVDPRWLPALLVHLEDQTVGVVGGAVLSRQSGNWIERFGERIHDQRAAIERYDPPYVASGNWASRRDVLISAGLFDESLLRGQDADLSIRIHRSGFQLRYADEARVFHRNESTLHGLAREGFQHGAASFAVNSRLGLPGARTPLWGVHRRLLADIVRLFRSPGREAILMLLFNLGKSTGELVASFGAPSGSRSLETQ